MRSTTRSGPGGAWSALRRGGAAAATLLLIVGASVIGLHDQADEWTVHAASAEQHR